MLIALPVTSQVPRVWRKESITLSLQNKEIDCPCELLLTSGQRIYDCERLGRRMTPHRCKLYTTNDNYRRAWNGDKRVTRAKTLDEKQAPREAKDSRAKNSRGRKGLGDCVEQALTSVGITSERVERWLGRPCGCAKRRERLNRLGAWALRVVNGKTERAEEYLEEIIEDT